MNDANADHFAANEPSVNTPASGPFYTDSERATISDKAGQSSDPAKMWDKARQNAARSTPLDKARQAAVALTLVAVLAMNTAASLLPLFGVSTAQVSDDYPTRFTPAGWTFSIWSIIYLGLIGYAVYQALPDQAAKARQRRIGWLFVVNGAANIAWLLAWHSLNISLSLMIMFLILATLMLIYRGLERDRPKVNSLERWLLDVPFSLYLAWITIATIANAAIALTAGGWGGWGIAPEIWSAILIMVGGGLAAYIAYTRRDLAWAAVVTWALFGIMSGQADAPLVVTTARIMAGAIALTFLAGMIRGFQLPREMRAETL